MDRIEPLIVPENLIEISICPCQTAIDEDGTVNANSLEVRVGTVIETQRIRLVEDDRFISEYRTTLSTTAEGQTIQLDIRNLTFDTDNNGRMNNAFEVAFIAADGISLVPTIRITRDGFLNVTEGETPFAASNILYSLSAGRIIFDLSQLPVGTTGTLILRLVNNDADTTASVEINPKLYFIDTPFDNMYNMRNRTDSTAVRLLISTI